MTDLFTPYSIGSLQLDNRVVMAPMTRNFSPNNVPNDAVVEYYRKRAAGGTGLIISEGTCVGHKAAHGYPNVPSIAGEEALAGWKRVVEAVHQENGKIAAQLWHVGAFRKPGVNPGGDLPGYSPSGMLIPGKVVGHAMTREDVHEVRDAFIQAGIDAKKVGFDAVEIHGAHGYIIDGFFWEGTNQRSDEYGGSVENRLRLAQEIIEGIRAGVGADFPIILRYSQWKQQDFSARLADTPKALEEFLTPLAQAGVDIFHCSQRRFWESEFEGSDLNLAGWTKKLSGKDTMTVGSVSLDADFIPEPGELLFKSGKITNLDALLNRLNNGEFDLVAVGRAMIANPDWAEKVRTQQMHSLSAYEKDMLTELI